MNRFKRNETIDIKDMYAMKAGKLWVAFKQEHLSLWMLCAYFLFEYIRPQTLYKALDILPWAQLFLILTMVAAFMDPTVRGVKNIQNGWMIIFTVVIVASGVAAFRPSVALDYWSVFGGWLVVYFLVITIVNTEKRLLLFLLAYCLFNLKMSQHGAISWAMRGFSFTSYGLVGAPGWFKNSGEFAIQMLVFGSLIVAMVYSLKDHWSRNKRWIFFAIAATGYLSVMGASSRGSQLGLAAIAIWMLLKQKNGLKGLLVISILAAALYYLLPDEQMQRFNEMGEDENSLQRLAYWSYGLNEVIPNHPFLGVGYFNWLPYLNYAEPTGLGPMQTNQVSHNIYIQAAAELGIPGLIVFLFLVLFSFVNNARTRKLAKQIDNTFLFNVSYGLDAGLIGFLIAGSFVTVLFYPFFWIQAAMIVMLNNVTNIQYQAVQNAASGKGGIEMHLQAQLRVPARAKRAKRN